MKVKQLEEEKKEFKKEIRDMVIEQERMKLQVQRDRFQGQKKDQKELGVFNGSRKDRKECHQEDRITEFREKKEK